MIGKESRQSNIELLRIVSMLMIVAHHFSYHGGFTFDQLSITFKDSPFLVPYSLVVIVLVFAVCTLVELLRQVILEKHYMPLITKTGEWVSRIGMKRKSS